MQHISMYSIRTWLIHCLNAAGVLDSQKGVTRYSYVPSFVENIVFHSSPCLI